MEMALVQSTMDLRIKPLRRGFTQRAVRFNNGYRRSQLVTCASSSSGPHRRKPRKTVTPKTKDQSPKEEPSQNSDNGKSNNKEETKLRPFPKVLECAYGDLTKPVLTYFTDILPIIKFWNLEGLLEVSDFVFSPLVKLFYATASFDMESLEISSWVFGRDIRLNFKTLYDCFNLDPNPKLTKRYFTTLEEWPK